MRTLLTFAFQMTFFAVLFGNNTPYYTVKFPDDYTVYGCAADPGITYPYITQNYNCSFNVGVSYTDQVFYLNSTHGCSKILRTWKLIYWCDYDPNWPSPTIIQNPANTDIGPTVTANSYNHGYLQYTQIIKVIDTEDPYFPDCPDETVVFCDYTNNDPYQYHYGQIDLCEGPVDLQVKVTDDCSETDVNLTYRLFLDLDGNGSMETYVSSSSQGAWPIETSIDGGLLCGKIKFPPGHGFPYGKHKIEWIASDNCGNDAICKYEFEVSDCKPPTVVCYYGLSVNIMQTGMVTIWDTDFIKDLYDNCTPTNKIRTGIRKQDAGTGFPADSHSITFDCNELGKQYVEVWAVDESGAADFCVTHITVQDNIGACPPSSPFKGILADAMSNPVSGAQVTLKKGAQTMAVAATNDDGEYQIGSMAPGCNYILTPSMNTPAKLGVNTLDALLVAGQVDNILPLPTPYQLLAADVDKDGNLTATDIANIVKMALGTQDNFPTGANWQFIPKNYVFPNPSTPWSASIPSSLTFCLTGDINFNPDFTAVKIGDVNGSANDNFAAANDRNEESDVVAFQTSNKSFGAGQEIRVDIFTPDLANLAAFQFTLDFDPSMLSLVGVESDLVPADFIGQPEPNRLTASWHSSVMLDPNIQVKNLRLRAFTLVFNTLQKRVLSQAVQMTSNVTEAEAYNRQLKTLGATLQFVPVPPKKDNSTPLFFQVQPNPVRDRFTAAYYLPEAGETTLTLTDATGRILQTIHANSERGYYETELDIQDAQPGLFFLRLDGPGGTDLQRVMKF